MGINRRSENKGNAKVAMNMEEFKAWVRTNIDADKDGRITKDELADILRRNGAWFAGWKARKWIRSADSNRNGVVDEIEIGDLVEFVQKHISLQRSGRFANWKSSRAPCADSSGMDFHRRMKMSDRFHDEKQRINAGKAFQNYDINELIMEAGRLSAPAKSEAQSMFLTEEQLKEVFKRFEAIEEQVLDRVDLKKAFNHFGLFFPHHAAHVFDAKKEGCVKLTELDDLVNSAVRLGYTVN